MRELLYGRDKRHKHRILFNIGNDAVHILNVRHTARRAGAITPLALCLADIPASRLRQTVKHPISSQEGPNPFIAKRFSRA